MSCVLNLRATFELRSKLTRNIGHVIKTYKTGADSVFLSTEEEVLTSKSQHGESYQEIR